jgi:predicted membrane protein
MRDSKYSQRRMANKMDGEGRIWGGAFILLIGVAALAKSFFFGMDWLFSWQMLLIALGCFIGLRSKFRGGAWLALIIIGSYFLFDNYFSIDHSLRKMFWPIALIVLGAYLIIRPDRKKYLRTDDNPEAPPPTPGQAGPGFTNTGNTNNPYTNTTAENILSGEEVLDVTAVFAGVKKNIYSKNFKGGEIVSVFGGAEVNLTQASFQQPQVEIESVQIFGGAKLIVPADWVIHNEAVAIFGGIEDKRPQPIAIPVPAKVLVLKGFVMFGGIEIKSY